MARTRFMVFDNEQIDLYSTDNAASSTIKRDANGVLITGGTKITVPGLDLSAGTLTNGTYQGSTIAANYGGTGQSVFVVGNILYADTTTTLAKLAIGANGTFLMAQGGVPVWSNTLTGNLVITGNLTVNGTTVTMNSSTLDIDDKNITIGAVTAMAFTANITAGSAILTNCSIVVGMIPGQVITITSGGGAVTSPGGNQVQSIDSATQITLTQVLTGSGSATGATMGAAGASDTTADGGGLTLKGTSDKTIIWDNATSNWTLNQSTTVTGTFTVSGSGGIVTTQTTGPVPLFNTNLLNLQIGGAATTIGMGASTGTFTIGNATLTLTNAATINVNGASPTFASSSTGTLTLFNTNLLTVSAFGAATSLSLGVTTTAAQTVNIGTGATLNSTTKAVNIGTSGVAGSTTNIAIGSSLSGALGTLTLGSPTIVGGASNATLVLFNTVATNVSFAGAATTLSMGAATGTFTVGNATVTLTNAATVNVNGANPSFISSSTGTLTLFNASLTAVNAFQAATTISMGAATGTFTIGNATLTLTNAATINVNGASPTFASSSTGTLTFFNTAILTATEYGAATQINIGTTVTAAQTINIGTSTTGASTINLFTGATLTATTKAINIGTTGVSGSTTNVAIGSTVSGALGTLTLGSATVVGGASNATLVLFNTIATSVTAFGAALTLDLGSATGAQTVNLGAGATTGSTTKAINIGTTGTSTSTTNITLGSAVAGALGTTRINTLSNLIADASALTTVSYNLAIFTGTGWGVQYLNSKYTGVFDNLVVRGSMSVYELLIQQVRATNGSVFVTSVGRVLGGTGTGTDPKLKLFITDAASTPTTSVADATAPTTGFYVILQLEDEPTFAVNDLVRARRVSISANDGTTVTQTTTYQVDLQVTAVSYANKTATAQIKAQTGTLTMGMFRGMEFVRIGNTSVTARQGSVYMSSDGANATDNANAPFVQIVDAVANFSGGSAGTNWSDAATIKAQLGKLSGISDAAFGGTLTGYGLYTQNAYFKGNIAVVNTATSQAMVDNSIMIGNITGTPTSTNKGIKISVNTGGASANDGIFGYSSGSTLSFALRMDGTAQIAGFYFDSATLWSGNSAKANAATTVYIDTTKIALGATASGVTIAGTEVGFAVDTTGYMKSYVNTTNYLRINASGVDMKASTFSLVGGHLSLVGSSATGSIKVGTLTDATTTATTNSGFMVDDNGNVLIKGNISDNDYIKVAGGGTITIKATTFVLQASGTSSIGLGATSYTAGAGVWLSNAASTKFRVGTDSTHARMQWDDTNLEIYNSSNTKMASFGASNTIGGWTIGSTNLYNVRSGFSTASAGIYIGTDGIAMGSAIAAAEFSVTSAGLLTAKSGSIGGWDISSTMLSKTTGSVTLNLDPAGTISITDSTSGNMTKLIQTGIELSDYVGPSSDVTAVATVNITNANSILAKRYTVPPNVVFASGAATAVAILDGFGVVYDIEVTSGGTGYGAAPGVTFTGGTLAPGTVIGYNISYGGTGLGTSTVVVLGGSGGGAAITANVVGGVVTSLTINNPGTGYTTVPELCFNDTAGTGTLVSASGTTVNGSGTNWLTSLAAGDTITSGGQSRIVSSVSSDTLLYVTTAWTTGASSWSYSKVHATAVITNNSATRVDPAATAVLYTNTRYRTGLMSADSSTGNKYFRFEADQYLMFIMNDWAGTKKRVTLSGSAGAGAAEFDNMPIKLRNLNTSTGAESTSSITLSNNAGQFQIQSRNYTMLFPNTQPGPWQILMADANNFMVWGSVTVSGVALTSINGLIASTQFIDKVDDTNVTMTISQVSGNTNRLTLGWTSQLSTTRGGTGLASYTAGDMIYWSSGTAMSKVGIGTTGQVLKSTGTAPQWADFTSLNVINRGFVDSGGILQDASVTIGSYTVGNNKLFVYVDGMYMRLGTGTGDKDYYEVGSGTSTTIKFNFDIAAGAVIGWVVFT